MNTEFLDRMAEQLRAGKSPACRRAIARLLTTVQKRWERREFESQSVAEAAFRELVDNEPLCRQGEPT
jgi:hypothetical protein